MYAVDLDDGEGFAAWLGTDGRAHACPTPDPDQAIFDTAEQAAAAQIPTGWIGRVVPIGDWEVSRIVAMR